MKKMIMMLLVSLLMLMPCSALAEDTNWFVENANESWYELSNGDTVLTVRLPGNTKTGLTWSYEISDPSALELLTQETIVGESEGMAGAATTYVASFMTMANAENSASLILRCADESQSGEAAEATRVLDLSISADNRITVNSVLERESAADWYEYGDEGYVLTVRMPDAYWSFEIVDEDAIELITCDNSDGSFVASFMATLERAGDAEIVFKAADGRRTRAVNTFINESGWLDVNWVETFEVLEQAELVYCDVCSGWYEAGNIFRNHICLTATEAPAEVIVPVSFKTVNITASSLNVREGAGTEYDVVTVLKKGANAKFLGETSVDNSGADWYRIIYDGKTGWVSAKYAKLGGSGYVQIVNGNCNMRSKPNLNGDVITVVSKGAIITYLGQGETDERGSDWYKVSVSGKEGWVSSQYSKFVATNVVTDKKKDEYKYVQIKGGNCNMRKNPNLDATSILTIKKGSTAEYLGEKSTDSRGVDWYKVSYNGKKGWVSSKLAVLTKNKPAATKKPSATAKPSDKADDMRLVYNPNRYEVLKVTDIYSQNGRDYFVTGCFGKINSKGEPEKFDDRKSVTMPLVLGAEVMLPTDFSNDDTIDYVDSPEIWFNDARNYCGGSYSFYATFSMNESGALRSLVYKPVY